MLDKTKVEALRALFIDIVQDIRAAKANADHSAFYVSLEASGRTFNGEANLELKVGDYAYGDIVKGSELIPVFSEHMRRKGWQETNQALALPTPGVREDDLQPADDYA